MSTTNLDPASWLNNQLFQKVLAQKSADRSLEVDDIHLALVGSGVQRYASTIYRATVNYRSRGRTDTIRLMVKLVASKVNSSADDGSSYDTELNVYRKFVTKVTDTGASKFMPELIYAADNPQAHIILEDLTSHHYEPNRKLLGSEDAKVVLQKLAQFHATSYSLCSTSSNRTHEKVNNGLFRQQPSEGVMFMMENFSIFTEELCQWTGFERYAERLHNMQSKFIERGAQVYGGDSGFSTRVLNHGDFNCNNMLFKFDNDRRVTDVMFYDFQLSCWTTPAVDLLYFLYLVCDSETRETQRDELLQLYQREFTATLSNLGFMGKAPSLLEINCDLLRAGFLEVAIAVCFVPFLYADSEQASNVHSSKADARAFRQQLYNQEEYQAIIKPLLRSFLHKGFLD